ncbi:MAG: DUF2510 domain-containing protein [Ilumatobacter sp.]
MGAGSTPAGWYPDPEQQGGERYWNGALWTEDRRPGPAPSAPGAVPYAAPQATPFASPAASAPGGYTPYGAGPGTVYPSSAMAGWGLGLSIAGLVLFCCFGIILSLPGAIMGYVHMQAVDRGERDPNSRGTAKAAFIVGLVGIVITLLIWIPYLLFIGIAGFGG